MFKKLKSITIFSNKWITILKDLIKFPNGQTGHYTYVKRSDGAGLVILDEKNQIMLIKQYRYPIKKLEWNIPGGAIDSDSPKQGVLREVE